MAFEQIIGNDDIKNLLENTLKKNNVLHSYLFCGIEGIGKFLFAKEFAKGILCMNNENAPCGLCKSCIEFETYNNPDFHIIDVDKDSIKIDQIRIMNEKIFEKPISSKRKVYVINNSEKMTIAAQNSLLKTLEEPPEYATVILICNQENLLLPTVKSRCTRIDFHNLTNEEIEVYLKNNSIDFSKEILELSRTEVFHNY